MGINILGLVGLVGGTEFFIHKLGFNQGAYYGVCLGAVSHLLSIVSVEKNLACGCWTISVDA